MRIVEPSLDDLRVRRPADAVGQLGAVAVVRQAPEPDVNREAIGILAAQVDPVVALILIRRTARDGVSDDGIEAAAVVLHLNSELHLRADDVAVVLDLLQLRHRDQQAHLINVGVGDRAGDRCVLLNRQTNSDLLDDLITELQPRLIPGTKARRYLDILEVVIRA